MHQAIKPPERILSANKRNADQQLLAKQANKCIFAEHSPHKQILNIAIILATSLAMRKGFSDCLKFSAATAAVVSILDQLKTQDNLAIILSKRTNPFLLNPLLAKSLKSIEKTDVKALKAKLESFNPVKRSNANFTSALKVAIAEFPAKPDINNSENHIIILTGDSLQNNSGDARHTKFITQLEIASRRGIQVSFVGIDVDPDADFSNKISSMNNVAYYSTSTLEDIKRLLQLSPSRPDAITSGK